MLLSEIVTFLTKKRVFSKIPPKCFQKTVKHNLAVCGSFCEEKKILLIFVLVYCFVQKGLFTINPIFVWVCPFSNLLRKTNLLSISEFLSERVNF